MPGTLTWYSRDVARYGNFRRKRSLYNTIQLIDSIKITDFNTENISGAVSILFIHSRAYERAKYLFILRVSTWTKWVGLISQRVSWPNTVPGVRSTDSGNSELSQKEGSHMTPESVNIWIQMASFFLIISSWSQCICGNSASLPLNFSFQNCSFDDIIHWKHCMVAKSWWIDAP